MTQNTQEIATLVEENGDAPFLSNLPNTILLDQNYPNPFNAETLIPFDLPHAADITLTIFNAAGQMVRQWQRYCPAGHHSLTWDGQNQGGNLVASGVYFYRLQAEDFAQIHSATLVQ